MGSLQDLPQELWDQEDGDAIVRHADDAHVHGRSAAAELRRRLHVASSDGLRHLVVLAAPTAATVACTFFIPAACSRRRYLDDGRRRSANDERTILWEPQPPADDGAAAADVVLPAAAADADDGLGLHGWRRASERAVVDGFTGGRRHRDEQQRSEQCRHSRRRRDLVGGHGHGWHVEVLMRHA